MSNYKPRADRYEAVLREIANIELGPTNNTAIQIARKVLTEEYIGKYRLEANRLASGLAETER